MHGKNNGSDFIYMKNETDNARSYRVTCRDALHRLRKNYRVSWNVSTALFMQSR